MRQELQPNKNKEDRVHEKFTGNWSENENCGKLVV